MFDTDIPKNVSTLLLATNNIPNINIKAIKITKEDLRTDEELEIKKNYFPIMERKYLVQDSYFRMIKAFLWKNH